jgi:hypothetical protein
MEYRVKKHPNGNQYVLTPQNMWVRNFTLDNVQFLDINKSITQADHFVFLENEFRNNNNRYTWVDSENFDMRYVAIVSDGYDFATKQKLLANLPKEVSIIAVNGALNKWMIPNRSPNWYVVNNPYPECMRYLPRRSRVLPRCIASCRTNHNFLSAYKGAKYRYFPTSDDVYAGIGKTEASWHVDDYRNPICSAIDLAYRFGAEKILLFCCDDSFKNERPGAMQLDNGLHQYPIQSIAHGLIDAKFYWLTQHPYFDYVLGDHSSGEKYRFAPYIAEEDFLSFFNKVGEKYG